jgi:hypothetical protein
MESMVRCFVFGRINSRNPAVKNIFSLFSENVFESQKVAQIRRTQVSEPSVHHMSHYPLAEHYMLYHGTCSKFTTYLLRIEFNHTIARIPDQHN